MKIFTIKIYVNLLLIYFFFTGLSFIIGGFFVVFPKFIPILWVVFAFLIIIYQLIFLDLKVFRFRLYEVLFWFAVFFLSIASLIVNRKLYLFDQFFTVFVQVFGCYLIVPLLRGTYIDEFSFKGIQKSMEYFCWLNVIIVALNFSNPSISFFGESYISEGGSRAFGWMGDQISLIFSFFISIFLGQRKYMKTAIVFVALLLTGSIGATLIAIIVGIVFLWPYIKRKLRSRNSRYSALATGLFIFLVSYSIVIPNAFLFKRISIENLDPSEEKSVGFHRIMAFETAVDSWSENIFLGTGFGTYAAIMHKKYSYLVDDYESNISITSMVSAFNQLLQFLVEIGLIGVIFVIVYFYKLIREINFKLLQTKNIFARSFLIWLIILLIFNQTAIWFLPGSLILYFFFYGSALSVAIAESRKPIFHFNSTL